MILITITKGKIYINLQPKNKQTKNFRNIIKKNKSKIKKEFRNQKIYEYFYIKINDFINKIILIKNLQLNILLNLN